MAHTLKFHTPSIDVMHQRSMMESLTYRLRVARSTRNTELIEKLEQEQQQLAPNMTSQASVQLAEFCSNAIKTAVGKVFRNTSTLQVQEFSCGSDRWWYTFDPSTGECMYANSEIELSVWLEKTCPGKLKQ